MKVEAMNRNWLQGSAPADPEKIKPLMDKVLARKVAERRAARSTRPVIERIAEVKSRIEHNLAEVR